MLLKCHYLCGLNTLEVAVAKTVIQKGPKCGGIPTDRRSNRPITEKGPIDQGSDRPIIEKGPIDQGSDRPIIEKGPTCIDQGSDRPIITCIDRLLERVR